MKLSIITINYNNLEGLKKTYGSVISQTCQDFEWIIIDGGSTDGSKEFIEEHQEHFAYWCSEPDKGVYNAMNKGIAKAKGEYINFMNSGDCFAFSSTLEKVFSLNYHEDILFGYMMRKTIDGIPHNIPSMKSTLYWEDFYFDTLPHQSSYIKRELFDRLGGYDETYPRLADWKWFMYAIVKEKATYHFIQDKLSVYECGGISEDEYMRVDLARLRKEFYPSYLAETDLQFIRELRTILNNKYSRFAFRVAWKLAKIINRRKTQAEFNFIRFKVHG